MIKHIHFNQITSTNEFACEIIKNESEILITADYQTKGKGRNNRSWIGDYGQNIYLSYAINHLETKGFRNIITYLAATSILTLQTLQQFAPITEFRIKYPNDIYAKENNTFKKISGILTEHIYSGSSLKYSIIGIGINVKQTKFENELINKATSLSILKADYDLNNIITTLIQHFSNLYHKNEKNIFEIWKNLVNLENKKVLLLSNNQDYTVSKHLEDGRLLLQNQNHSITIDDGESIIYELQ